MTTVLDSIVFDADAAKTTGGASRSNVRVVPAELPVIEAQIVSASLAEDYVTFDTSEVDGVRCVTLETTDGKLIPFTRAETFDVVRALLSRLDAVTPEPPRRNVLRTFRCPCSYMQEMTGREASEADIESFDAAAIAHARTCEVVR